MSPLIAANHLEVIRNAVGVGELLEWGCGGSTLWFISQGISIVSIEHDHGWYMNVGGVMRITETIKPSELYHITGQVGEYGTPMEECPSKLNRYIFAGGIDFSRFSTYFVDGVARGSILAVLRIFGKRGASVFLHDSERDWYDWAIKLYPEPYDSIKPDSGGHTSYLLRLIIPGNIA